MGRKSGTTIAAEWFSKYKENTELEQFNILHLYDTKRLGQYNDGYVDSRFFKLVVYNSQTMQYRTLGDHFDAVFPRRGLIVDDIRIFADGSTLIRFTHLAMLDWLGQAIHLEPVI